MEGGFRLRQALTVFAPYEPPEGGFLIGAAFPVITSLTMGTPEPLNSPLLQSKALLWLIALVTVLFGMVLWPLSGAVSWAVFMAIVF